MNLAEFVREWSWKQADWGGAQGGQCIDLFRFYCHQVLDMEQPADVACAAEFWRNYDVDPNLRGNFDKFPNTPDGVPQYGDVVIWDTHVGDGGGHVAICLSGEVTKFSSLDQGWPIPSNVSKSEHNYTHVLGWLRPKNQAAIYGA